MGSTWLRHVGSKDRTPSGYAGSRRRCRANLNLIVARGDDALIIDVKTGREQPWHAVQVMIYQYAIPRALPQYRNVRMVG